jgi:DNA-nicking Smr family endonuclease
VRPEATADLHGRSADDARRKLSRFLDDSAAVRRRCVLVIHGRGLHSGNAPVLKDRVIDWLSTSPAPIRGFCSARPADGGTGALYVLLGGE